MDKTQKIISKVEEFGLKQVSITWEKSVKYQGHSIIRCEDPFIYEKDIDPTICRWNFIPSEYGWKIVDEKVSYFLFQLILLD